MDSKVNEIRFEQWKKVILKANASGMMKKEWCQLNGITLRKFYYWQKKIRAAALVEQKSLHAGPEDVLQQKNSIGFLEVRPPAETYPSIVGETFCEPLHFQREDGSGTVILQAGSYIIRVGEPSAESTLRMVLKVLANA